MIEEHGIKHSRSQGLIDFAYRFAKESHYGQVRKYTDEPYINHPVEVAQIVAGVTDDVRAIAAAFLHDVIEDCGVTVKQLIDAGFSFDTAMFVNQLTDISLPTDGNRKFRKELDRRYLSRATPLAKTIKLADLISNSKSIIKHDPKFAKTYMAEKRELLKVLIDGDHTLYVRAKNIVDDYYGEL